MPSKRGSAVAAVVNGKIYVIGGAAIHPGSSEPSLQPAKPHRSVGTVEEYDPKTNSWAQRSSMPTARNHAAIGAVNNKIYVIGGRLGSAFIFTASNTNVVEEYDPAIDQVGSREGQDANGAERRSLGGLQWTHLCGWRRTSG
jgi:N-acetylneuraminic acid mutarotase